MKLIDFQRSSVTQYWGELIFILPSLSFKWEELNIDGDYYGETNGAILELYFEFIHKSYNFTWVFRFKEKKK